VIGGGKVRLADAEGNDVLPLGLQRGDLAENDEGILGS